MPSIRQLASILTAAACLGPLAPGRLRADTPEPASTPAQTAPQNGTPGKWTVTVGKSLIINIEKISVANGDLVEAVAVRPNEVLINGKAPGETSLIVWQQGGNRLMYDLTVRPSPLKLEAVRQQIAREFPDDNINVTFDNDTPFVRGTVKNMYAADRVMAIATTLGGSKPVNLLNVAIPTEDPQILLRVRFANVDRSVSSDLGVNIASGAFNQSSRITTGQYTPLQVDTSGAISLSDALNIFLFRKDINLGATIKALQGRNLLETLAEPNVLAINGKEAFFVSGGEIPVPMVQGGGAVGTVTIQFKQYGIRLNFLPNITPRGTIRLEVAPEVSSLDYAHAVQLSGFTIPAFSLRRVQTEVELDSGQSFVIAGLLDDEVIETLSKIPGLASVPLFGKLFQSRSRAKNNTELLVIVTPEIVRPLPGGQPIPELKYPSPFLPANSGLPMRQPAMDKTGPVPVHAPTDTVPVEQLMQLQKQAQPPAAAPTIQLVPMPTQQAPPNPNPGLGKGGGGEGK